MNDNLRMLITTTVLAILTALLYKITKQTGLHKKLPLFKLIAAVLISLTLLTLVFFIKYRF